MPTEPIIWFFKLIWTYLDKILSFVTISRWTEISTMTPLMRGVILQIALIIGVILAIKFFRKSKFGIWFSLIFEYMYEFFEEILGKTQKEVYKVYVVSLFFIVLFSNLLSYIIDLIRVVFTDIEALTEIIVVPTTNFNFNLALAIASIVVMLFVQFRRAWVVQFFLEYVPITWKWILDIERWNMNPIIYWPIKVVVKVFDIGISLFVWLLDIIWIAAKVISLTARLYWNMLAWGILLWLLVTGVNSIFQNLFAADFPVLGPLILYAQWLLVALIQAFVFPLLVAIFIKIAQESE